MIQGTGVAIWLIAIFFVFLLTITLTTFFKKDLSSAVFISILIVILVLAFREYKGEISASIDKADASLFKFFKDLAESLIRKLFNEADADYLLRNW